jgi:phenylalanyl-tRNA synthetase beta chain
VLRPALLPGVLRAVGFNNAHGEPAVALFETGTVWAAPQAGDKLPTERMHLAFARSAEVRRVPHEPNRPVDVYDAKAVLDALMDELRIANWSLVPSTRTGFHPSRQADVVVGGAAIGVIGEVAADVVDGFGATGPIVACELDVVALLAADRVERRSVPISRFPGATIDLAFVVDTSIAAADLEATIRRAAGELLEDLRLFDIFRADSLGENKVSLAFALRFRAPDHTLTDEEVAGFRQAAIDAAAAVHGATLRS